MCACTRVHTYAVYGMYAVYGIYGMYGIWYVCGICHILHECVHMCMHTYTLYESRITHVFNCNLIE